MPSRPQPPERRRLEANRGLRSRAARADRPKLAEALAACRLHRAKLIIAKLDGLARNDFRRGWPEFLAHGRHFDFNTSQEAAICWAELGAGYTGKINSAGLDDRHP